MQEKIESFLFKEARDWKKYYRWTIVLAFISSYFYVVFGIEEGVTNSESGYNGLTLLREFGVNWLTFTLSILSVFGIFIIPGILIAKGINIIFNGKPNTIIETGKKVPKLIGISVIFIVLYYFCVIIRGDVSWANGKWIGLKDYFYLIGIILPSMALSYAEAIKTNNAHKDALKFKEDECIEKDTTIHNLNREVSDLKEQLILYKKYEWLIKLIENNFLKNKK
ncbi:hypothetical protein [Lysinibacillus sphaericus]|uniref:hypothetical protein n=1 Tax=Lysinibacillus sphaericus TaxID=1421 RepID=UPI000C1A3246|nr:hypothetical protein [Lysinibacillus sphaericus]PIJ98020.1 hypothetical protein CTN02_09760 [Lysinibacillus sphaericus]